MVRSRLFGLYCVCADTAADLDLRVSGYREDVGLQEGAHTDAGEHERAGFRDSATET